MGKQAKVKAKSNISEDEHHLLVMATVAVLQGSREGAWFQYVPPEDDPTTEDPTAFAAIVKALVTRMNPHLDFEVEWLTLEPARGAEQALMIRWYFKAE